MLDDGDEVVGLDVVLLVGVEGVGVGEADRERLIGVDMALRLYGKLDRVSHGTNRFGVCPRPRIEALVDDLTITHLVFIVIVKSIDVSKYKRGTGATKIYSSTRKGDQDIWGAASRY